MASPSFTHFPSLPRWHLNWPFLPSQILVQLQVHRLQNNWGPSAVSKKKMAEALIQEMSTEEPVVAKRTSRTKRSPTKGRKKVLPEILEEKSDGGLTYGESVAPKRHPTRSRKKVLPEIPEEKVQEESVVPSATSEDPKNIPRRTRRKATLAPSSTEEQKAEKGRRWRKTKKIDGLEHEHSGEELSDHEGFTFTANMEDGSEEDLELEIDEGEDISFTYGWPPLVCCFGGSAQHAFLPSGRPANRLINHEMHETMKDALWTPEKFVRAPGGSSSSVALALAHLGGKVAFMGKLGDDDFGHSILYYLNLNNVQTRSVRIDSKKRTSVSKMKIRKRGGLGMTCVEPSADDSLLKSEINIDVLKEAKMFYFNTSSLINQNMRSTALRAIKISKKFGGVIFYDLNLPLPLWQSQEETKIFMQQVWNLSDVIEVTKQELEFLCGIKPSENFDTKDNDKSKFVHYGPEVIAPLWHENLKVLFVTNGTSKVHYYTENDNSFVRGTEDVPITPFTCDMSASGDSIVAALMRMLTVQPDRITDKGYLEHSIGYAINCGFADQWKLARQRGYPPKPGVEEEVIPDANGLRSITEREYRTRVS
ncbi:fructokinase-like 2, chloroplastic [Malania oleifera]|uniref:fructokinase-like 2, chloroplastic n=1 Tax=Malania oleifera TaxID=397392 RepID=UPI0025AE1BE8|nr:fructokinase-like 2, chloroplastic [Malania oleifera]